MLESNFNVFDKYVGRRDFERVLINTDEFYMILGDVKETNDGEICICSQQVSVLSMIKFFSLTESVLVYHINIAYVY